jgi:hypothetical protein
VRRIGEQIPERRNPENYPTSPPPPRKRNSGSQQEFRALMNLAERMSAELNAYHRFHDPGDSHAAKLLLEFEAFRACYHGER